MDRWELDVSALDVQATFVASEALELYLAFLRMVSPFRIWNSYGVFIPRGNVPHQVAVLQATTDGETWSDLEPKWLSCDVARKPPRFAPHHPRLDHWLFTKDLAWRAFGWLV